jgi:hypothetical protein
MGGWVSVNVTVVLHVERFFAVMPRLAGCGWMLRCVGSVWRTREDGLEDSSTSPDKFAFEVAATKHIGWISDQVKSSSVL